jgi:hypothetical protein
MSWVSPPELRDPKRSWDHRLAPRNLRWDGYRFLMVGAMLSLIEFKTLPLVLDSICQDLALVWIGR